MAESTIPTHWSKTTKIIPAYYPREAETVRRPDDQLYIVLDDYIPSQKAPQDAITIIMTHGTSFNKESWELIIAGLVSQPPLDSHIKRFIAIDVVNHGDSAIQNISKLGDRVFWPDISRDILKTLDMLDVTGPLVGIGHSFGGSTLLHAAMMAPSRFTATILVEPILFQMRKKTQAIAQLTMRRRDRWDTLDQVQASFTKAFHDWNPAQLDKYIHHGTCYMNIDAGPSYWTLKTPKAQEAATYIGAPYPRILELLAQSSQQHYFIFGERSNVINEENRQKVSRLSQRSGSVDLIANAGHLIPMTHPQQLSILLKNLLVGICAFDTSAKI